MRSGRKRQWPMTVVIGLIMLAAWAAGAVGLVGGAVQRGEHLSTPIIQAAVLLVGCAVITGLIALVEVSKPRPRRGNRQWWG